MHQKSEINNNLRTGGNGEQRHKIMITINCNNSKSKAVKFFNNGSTIMVFAIEEGEYWFTIGDYRTEAGAKRAATRVMAKYGYTFDAQKMKNIKIR